MSLFSSPFYVRQTNEPSLVPLFRLLDEFDRHAQDQQVAQPETKKVQRASPRLPTFKPKFDIRETENTYELHGELAGIQRENLNIEFTDPRTIHISGRIERTKEQQPAIEEQHAEVTEAEKTNNHRATVEDDPEDETASNKSWTSVDSPKSETAAEPAKTQIEKTPRVVATPKKNDQPSGKIWLWERSVGEFSRTFTFPKNVDHDGVSASLKNGVLHITVPKKAMHQPRRIAIL